MPKQNGYFDDSNLVINGYWDGEPIVRQRTAAEKLAQLLFKADKNKHEQV